MSLVTKKTQLHATTVTSIIILDYLNKEKNTCLKQVSSWQEKKENAEMFCVIKQL